MAASSRAETELQAAKTLVRREVLRQGIAPARVLLQRLVLYYLTERRGFSRPWVSAKNALTQLEGSGALTVREINGVKWYHLPRAQSERIELTQQEKVPVYTAWNAEVLLRGGTQAEIHWRDAFRAAGWVVPSERVLLPCPRLNDGDATHGQSHEIDVWAYRPRSPYCVGGEIKNGPGEGWVGPDVVREWKLTKAQRNIRHHFAAMHELGLSPMLAAPFVDPSFFGFQYQYEGIHCRYLYHVFHPDDREVAEAVREVFRIGHVWFDRAPPPVFTRFVGRIPDMLDRMWETRPTITGDELEPDDSFGFENEL